MDTMKLEIVTPQGSIFSDDIKSATLPGSEGEFGVLPGHASLVSLLKAGAIEIEKTDGNKEIVAVNWGHVRVSEESIDILADGAVAIAGDGESDIAKALDEAKKLLSSISDSDIAIAAATAKIESAARGRL